MNKPAFLFAIFCCLHGAAAQPPAPEVFEKDIQKAKKLTFSNLDSAVFFARQAEAFAIQVDSPRLLLRAYRTEGLIFENNNKFEAARDIYKTALDLAEKRLPESEQFKILNDWAIIHKKMGAYKIAHDCHLQAIERATKSGDWATVENNYHGLGTIYSYLGDFDKALEAYLKSIEAAEKRGNTPGVVLSKQNMSNVYRKAKNFEMAQKSIEETYRMAVEGGDQARIAAVLRIYGDILLDRGDADGALAKLLAAKAIFEQNGNKPFLAETLLSIAKVCILQKNYAAAKAWFAQCRELEPLFSSYQKVAFFYESGQFQRLLGQPENAVADFQKSLESIGNFGFRDMALNNHLALSETFAQLKCFPEAYQHQVEASLLNSQVFEENKQKSLAEAQLKYDFEKRDIQLQAQERSLKQSKIAMYALSGGILLCLGLLFFAFRQMRARRKSAQQVELLNHELHHRVKNNLQTITSILRLQSRQIQDPAALNVLNESRQRLEAISLIHQQIFQKDALKTVNFRQFAEEMTGKLSFLNGTENVGSNINIQPENMDVDVALPLSLILNELMTNSFKHAFPGMTNPSFEIEITPKKFHYRDNGSGIPTGIDVDQSSSFGFQLMLSLAQQVGKNARFFNRDGANFEMEFN